MSKTRWPERVPVFKAGDVGAYGGASPTLWRWLERVFGDSEDVPFDLAYKIMVAMCGGGLVTTWNDDGPEPTLPHLAREGFDNHRPDVCLFSVNDRTSTGLQIDSRIFHFLSTPDCHLTDDEDYGTTVPSRCQRKGLAL